MKKRSNFLPFLIILLFSCTGQTKKGIKFANLPKTIELEKNTLILDPELIVKMGTIDVLQNYLLIYDLQSKNQIYWIFDKNTGKLQNKFAHKGRGPNDITMPGFTYVDKKNNEIWINDAGRRKLMCFSLKHALLNAEPDFLVPYPKEIPILTNFYKLSDSIFVCRTFINKDFLLAQIDIKSQQTKFYGDKRFNDDPTVLNDRAQQYEFFFTKHPSSEKYACFYRYYDAFTIINSEGKTLAKERGLSYASLTKASTKSRKTYYRQIRCSKNFIYAQYLGDTYYDRKKDRINLPTKLRVFDWEGQPAFELEMGVGFSSFVLDQEKNRIICFTENKQPIAYFSFNEADYL